MTLMMITHGAIWDFVVNVFTAQFPTFEQVLMAFVSMVEEFLYCEVVHKSERK